MNSPCGTSLVGQSKQLDEYLVANQRVCFREVCGLIYHSSRCPPFTPLNLLLVTLPILDDKAFRESFHAFAWFTLPSSLQDASFGLEKARMRSGPSLGGFPSVVFETVSVLVRLTTAPFRLFEKDRRSSFCLRIPAVRRCQSTHGFVPAGMVSQAPQHFNLPRRKHYQLLTIG